MRQSIHPLGDTTYHFVKANVLNSLQDKEIAALKDRIKRLEEAGDALYEGWIGYGFTKDKHLAAWRKAKGTL
jgi:hypothetical protein